MIYFWQERNNHSWSMNSLYKVLSTSKQAFHQCLNLLLKQGEEQAQLLPLVRELRQEHPGMSSRQIYGLIRPETMGRDRFEAFCHRHGFLVEVKRSFHKTTNSLGVTRFENLVEGRELTGVNQVWVSDITYYRIGEAFYYLSFIMDLYSRRILGYSSSHSLRTIHTTLPAMVMAIQVRKGIGLKGLIMHSDGGGQYYAKKFLALTKDHKILNSMAESVYENANAERVNGTIKNYYLAGYKPQDYKQLKQMLERAVKNYNNIRPHSALNGLSPLSFEDKKVNT